VQPLPEDFDLFSEVDLVLTQIRQCYTEMDKFWRDEIYHVAKVLELRRVDAGDLDCWENFQVSLKETIESWKVWSLLPLLHIPINQNTLVRMSHQMTILTGITPSDPITRSCCHAVSQGFLNLRSVGPSVHTHT
jgi:hypothetical protein